jgi:predicted ATPase
MFTQLRFQNFKSWQDTGDIRMAPLTGFFGTNSSGKTAILQFLLMLKQTVESSDRKRILHTGDAHTYVDLGTTYDFIHHHQLPKELSFCLKWEPTSTDYLPFFPFSSYSINDSDPNLKAPLMRPYLSNIEFNCVIYIAEAKMKVVRFSYAYMAEHQQWNKVGIEQHNLDSYGLVSNGLTLADLSAPKTREPLLAPMKFYGFSSDAKLYFRGVEFLDELALALELQLIDFYYLGPLREYPKRIYSWSGEQPQDVGQRGEFAIQALLASRKDNSQVQEKVAYWLKELGLIHDFQLQPITANRQEYELLVRRTPNSPQVSIKDVGFGVSQVLPVLVLCYYAPQGSTIIFEQPEIHLHPSVQAGLADVFIDAIKTRNVQIMIESHSEHLLRRLQRRIAEEAQQFSHQDAALYFCHVDQDGKSILDSLQLDPYGNITNWPNGFFGDEMGDLVAMTEAAMQRQLLEQSS